MPCDLSYDLVWSEVSRRMGPGVLPARPFEDCARCAMLERSSCAGEQQLEDVLVCMGLT